MYKLHQIVLHVNDESYGHGPVRRYPFNHIKNEARIDWGKAGVFKRGLWSMYRECRWLANEIVFDALGRSGREENHDH